ncbi:MAG: 50S ribosomal protein L18Ae [Candidatus Bathyarchaeota archaeon]
MSEVKTFRVVCKAKVNFKVLFFSKEVRGLSLKEALEKVYSDIGSKNKLKRNEIKIVKVEEINPAEARNPLIRMIAGVELR